MGDSRSRRRRRWNLFKQNPFCHWCKRLVFWSDGHDVNEHLLQATLDHVRSRYDPTRGQHLGINTVLACRQCNQSRALQEEITLGICKKVKKGKRFLVSVADGLKGGL